MKLVVQGKSNHIILHKVGHTTRGVKYRIGQQEEDNKESYVLLHSVSTCYPRFVEYQMHQFLAKYRVCTMKDGHIKSGGTEWFLVDQVSVIADLISIKALMMYVWKDKAIA